jgi:hypothetical protein
MIKVLENFIPNYVSDIIEEIVTGDDYPWYYRKNTTNPNGLYSEGTITNVSNIKDSLQLIHTIDEEIPAVNPSPWIYNQLHQVLSHACHAADITPVGLLRAKTNLLLKDPNYPDDHFHYPHVDYINDEQGDVYTVLYYINDSDGDTIIFNERHTPEPPEKLTVNRVLTPKKGTGIIFKSDYFHASSSPKFGDRYVMNICFRGKRNG